MYNSVVLIVEYTWTLRSLGKQMKLKLDMYIGNNLFNIFDGPKEDIPAIPAQSGCNVGTEAHITYYIALLTYEDTNRNETSKFNIYYDVVNLVPTIVNLLNHRKFQTRILHKEKGRNFQKQYKFPAGQHMVSII